MKNALFVVLTMLSGTVQAQSVKEKKARANVDDRFATGAAAVDAASCGKQFKFVYDWKSFDAIDFKKAGREKMDTYSYEASSVKDLGAAIKKLCADKDYKEALSKVDTIVYKPTDNDKITVQASVAGSTLTIENFAFGSTRGTSDYQKAAKEAL